MTGPCSQRGKSSYTSSDFVAHHGLARTKKWKRAWPHQVQNRLAKSMHAFLHFLMCYCLNGFARLAQQVHQLAAKGLAEDAEPVPVAGPGFQPRACDCLASQTSSGVFSTNSGDSGDFLTLMTDSMLGASDHMPGNCRDVPRTRSRKNTSEQRRFLANIPPFTSHATASGRRFVCPPAYSMSA